MRYVILGAGAIGGAIGGRLFQHGHDVVLIARGAHLAALRTSGLELRDPGASVRLDIESVASARDAKPTIEDVVILATKSQHSEALLAELAVVAPPGIAVVLAQNGVENERLSLRRFANTYGMRVILAGTHLEPGVVEISTAPLWGILDVGRYPEGVDELAEQIAADLRASGFDSTATPAVMSHKYLKLLSNLSNAIQAACGIDDDPIAHQLGKAARAEARACYAAAGIECADEGDEAERRRRRGLTQPVGGVTRQGGSSWQSLRRGTGNIEADWLNGEIVLLGRLHGVPTPVNERLQAVANRMAHEGLRPASIRPEDLAAGLL
ncbi:MAG: 2-dehydropantoate 2-reductase N-terminal domain-containing protein [Acidimicrobiales bacterium]|jgi:2-dehydropantoate 2-reductase